MKKKVTLLTITALVLISIINLLSVKDVNAAYAYSWKVNGESLMIGSANSNNTATWSSSDQYTGGILTLNNYNGGQLEISCYGTGLGHVFAIELIGENTITVPEGTGLLANEPIVFIGDGTLTINAKNPIDTTYGDWWTETPKLTIAPTIKVNQDTQTELESSNEKENEEAEEIEQTEKSEQATDSTIIIIILACCLVISLISTVIICTKTNKEN